MDSRELLLNLNDLDASEIKYTLFKFNDGELHIDLCSFDCERVKVVTSLCGADELFRLMLVDGILSRLNIPYSVHITYLIGQRMDRVMSDLRPFTLSVVRNALSFIKADTIHVYCPHNSASDAFSSDWEVVTPTSLWDRLSKGEFGCVVGADSSALKHYTKNYEGYFHFNKVRNVDSGKIESIEPCESLLKFINDNPEYPIVVVDDLCDMGGTFTWGLSKLRKLGYKGHATLCVYHAPVQEGLEKVCKVFDKVIVTNSCPKVKELSIQNLKVINYDE